jgi:hypothetical protein
MSARKMRRARARALAAGAAATVAAAVAAPAASADSVVTTLADTGAGSLRQAIVDSNADPDADTITFASNVTGNIALGSELAVNYATVIDGPGAGVLTVSAPTSRAIFFYPFAAGPLEIEGVTLTGTPSSAATAGAGVTANCASAQGSLVLRNAAITGSVAKGVGGGAIFSDGCDVSLVSSAITGNTAQGSNPNGDGGAILLRDSAGGGTADTLSIVDSRISENKAGHDAGGIFVDDAPAAVTIERSTISGNSATLTSFGAGGGLYLNDAGPVAIDSSTFSGNAAGEGGGMFVAGQRNPFSIRNSTFSGNSAQGGGLYLDNRAGQPMTIADTTVAANTGGDSSAGGIYFFGGSTGDDLALTSTIVADNTAGPGRDGPDLYGGSSSDGKVLLDHSLIGSTSHGPPLVETVPGSNLLDAGSAQLGPLADNGGPTLTMFPEPLSPAIDAGVANGETVDQRGLLRTVDQPLVPTPSGSDGTDIGAVELPDTTLEGADASAKKKQKQKGKKVVIKVEVGASENVSVTASGEVKLGSKTLALTTPVVQAAAGQTVTLKLKPTSKRATRKIVKALTRGKKPKASIAVDFTDLAGNSGEASATVKLVD